MAVIDLTDQENAAAPDSLAVNLGLALRNAKAGQRRSPGSRSAKIAAHGAEKARSGRTAGCRHASACGGTAGTVTGNRELAAIAGGAELLENLLGGGLVVIQSQNSLSSHV